MESILQMSLKIFKAALFKANAYEAVKKTLSQKGHFLLVNGEASSTRKVDLRPFKRIIVLGAGKASASMAVACEEVLGKSIHEGLIITKYGHSRKLSTIDIVEAGHPLPDQSGFEGAQKMVSILKAAQADDLIFFLTSGGCSALLPLPPSSISLAEKQTVTQFLLNAGTTIHEINTVRKHLSMTKGGQLAKLAFPATVINLILSDVVGDQLETIGSGPFVPDSSTFKDAWNVLKKYQLDKKVAPSIVRYFKKGLSGKIEDTPKKGHLCFTKVTHRIVATNLMAVEAAQDKAAAFGFKPIILSSQIQGEARELARFYGAIAREIIQSGHPAQKPICLLAGGEPTVTVTGKGLGGRNTELALAMAMELKGLRKIIFLSAGTDGTDGPTDAAGAVVNGLTHARALQKGISPEGHLKENDSYTFFKKAGGLLMTGPTRTNVMDLHILLAK
jgi:hydroxypyruvate reductase